MKELRFRQVHLDFHTSPHIPAIGAKFDKKQWQDALKKAHVGIAMGGVGSDIAVEAADIALVNDDIKELPHLLQNVSG